MKDNLKTKDTSMKTAKGTRPQAKRSVSRGNPRPIKRLKRVSFQIPRWELLLEGRAQHSKTGREGPKCSSQGVGMPPKQQ